MDDRTLRESLSRDNVSTAASLPEDDPEEDFTGRTQKGRCRAGRALADALSSGSKCRAWPG